MHIKVLELRRVANLLFDHLERTGQGEIDLTADYYWNIPDERLFEAEPPPEAALDSGQLSSDWEELKAVGHATDLVPSHDLRHMAAVLRFVAAKVLP